MGASVVIAGPLLAGLQPVESAVQRVITDAHGKFAIERLLPGWYSLQVVSATRLPVMRNRIRVEADQTARENFVLGDILAPFHLTIPAGEVSTWGEDWKWVLRTSSATRPVLRYQQVAKVAERSEKPKPPLPSTQRLIGVIPGSTLRDALPGDAGMGSVLAYLRPLSEDTDLLVVGSLAPTTGQASSLATVLRRDVLKGDPQELALVVHQLSFSDGLPLAGGDVQESMKHAQAMVLTYSQTRRLFGSLILTAGVEVNYLNAARDILSSQPSVKLQYLASPSNVVTVRYGAMHPDEGGTLLERVGVLTALPRVTLRGYRAQLEKLNHAEVSFTRRLSGKSRVEVAAYRDQFENAAIWGVGGPEALGGLAGDFLPNPASNGVTLNGGHYGSTGVRATYTKLFRGQLETAVLYSLGDALAVDPSFSEEPMTDVRTALYLRRTQSLAGRVTARVPVLRTKIVTSYEWLSSGRVTAIDPYGQADLELQPYLALQIRQPLPTLAFLPARIEALADFRNLLAQGYVPVCRSGDQVLLLTPAYRSFRGGFSVQF
jgi:hypothetical protein